MDNVIEVSQNRDVRRDLLDSNSPYCGKLFIQYPIITPNVLGHIQTVHSVQTSHIVGSAESLHCFLTRNFFANEDKSENTRNP